ncbi:MAG: flagellar biosynthetic protein FliR [Halanaerobiaceae bacterium]
MGGDILTDNTYLFVLIMARYLGLFLITPILGSKQVPRRVKLGLPFFLALISFPVFQGEFATEMPAAVITVTLELIRELTVGFIIGFIVYIIFSSLQLAGQFIDLRMGFRMANVVDPMYGTNSPLIGQFKNVLSILVFLAIDGHHILFRQLYGTFETIGPGGAVLSGRTGEYLMRISGNLFIIAFRIALPVVGTIFLADIILGFLVRTVPQLNIFIIGFPMKIILGFIVLMLAVGSILNYLPHIFEDMFRDIMQILRLLPGG